ncbi:MAG: hypothetical protein OHK0015_35980 [Chloroflexi bacterium OHK40]
MSQRRFTLHLRFGAVLLLLASLAVTAAFPRPAWAACGPLDMGACIDNAEYSFYYLVASIAWNVNRWLLLLAYQFDQLRTWLVTVAFSGAYQWLTSFIQPAYIPVATAALMLAAVLFMLVPITGETNIVNLRHVVVWAVMTPVVLTVAGQLVGQAEQLRSNVSSQLFAQMSAATPGAIFGSPGSDMATPSALYPANPCGTTLARTTTTGIAIDALAAALMYADAGDIHCPDARGPSRDIPDGFYNEPPAYAYDGYVGDLDSSVERRGWVEGMQRGMNRLLQGVIPSFLAVLESLIHLVFSLSMAVLWLSLPIGLIFVFFQQTASPVSGVLRRAASVLITSWMASLVMGVLSAALVAAAELGNAGAYTGMAFGGLFLMGYLCIVALTALWKSIGTVEHTALSIAGMSFTQPLQTAAQLTTSAVTGAAAGVATGGSSYLGMAAMGSAAFAQAKDAPLAQRVAYSASAMVGRLPGAGAVGEVAAAMGWLDTDGAVYEGVYAGDRSRHSWRSARLQMERDTAAPRAAPPPAGMGGPGPRAPRGRSAGPTAPGSALPPTASAAVGGVGLPGAAGAPGPQGQPGATGTPGAAGVSGAQGQPGQAGTAGAAGQPGAAGPAIPAAAAAAPLGTAAPGPAGQPGPVGSPGPAGASGSPGVAGAAGQPGPTGNAVVAGASSAPSAASQPYPPAPVGTASIPPRPALADAPGAAGSPGVLGPAGQAGAAGAAPGSTHPGSSALPLPTVSPPAAGVNSPAASSAPPQQLPANHPHLAYAASRVPPLPNRLHDGVDWAYAGSASTEAGYRHTFRHPRHPLTGRPEVRTVETTNAEIAAQPKREQEGGSS